MQPVVQRSVAPEPRIPPISGFWTRILAFAVDAIILIIAVMAYSLPFGNWLVSIGLWGHLIDLSIAFLYFGLLNSRLSSGQTAGKALCRIQVVGAGGAPVTVARSFVRAIPLSIFVWGYSSLTINRMTGSSPIELTWLTGSPYIVAFAGFVAFSLSLGVVWFYLFNTPTRQGLHDLLAGTYVVRWDTPGRASIAPVSRILVGLYLLFLLLGVVSMKLSWTSLRQAVASYSIIQSALKRVDGFVHLSRFERRGETLEVAALWIPNRISETTHADVVREVLLAYPEMQDIKQINVRIRTGFGNVWWGFGRTAAQRERQFRSQSVEAWRKELGFESRPLQ